MHPEPSQVVEVLDEDETFDPLFDEPKIKTKVPAHISRRENPLVKMADTGTLNLQGAIAAKVRAVREPNVGSSTSRVKPGPGRSSGGLLIKEKAMSSLFTAEKGVVKIIKGKFHKKEDAVPKDRELSPTILPTVESVSTPKNKVAPSGDELLQLAGLDQMATDLADFEDPKPDDGTPVEASAPKALIQPVQNPSGPAEANELSTFGSGYATYVDWTFSLDSFHSSRLFPQHDLPAVPTPARVFGKMHSLTQSTIFGPLWVSTHLYRCSMSDLPSEASDQIR
jgi:hypothetical protein